MLDEIGREMSGYMLGYNNAPITKHNPNPYNCRAWFAEHGPWFHGYGMTKEEAAEDCLEKVREFKREFKNGIRFDDSGISIE